MAFVNFSSAALKQDQIIILCKIQHRDEARGNKRKTGKRDGELVDQNFHNELASVYEKIADS